MIVAAAGVAVAAAVAFTIYCVLLLVCCSAVVVFVTCLAICCRYRSCSSHLHMQNSIDRVRFSTRASSLYCFAAVCADVAVEVRGFGCMKIETLALKAIR